MKIHFKGPETLFMSILIIFILQYKYLFKPSPPIFEIQTLDHWQEHKKLWNVLEMESKTDQSSFTGDCRSNGINGEKQNRKGLNLENSVENGQILL